MASNKSSSNNKIMVPQARAAMDKFKMEAANEVGVDLKKGYNGSMTTREAGSIGGQMMLFVVFTILTHYTLVYAGTGGLNLLSFISGFSDITPFILNLLQGTGSVAVLVITACSMQAIVSNIAVNMCYALFFAGGKSPLRPWILGGFGSVIAANICLLLFFYFL